MTHSMSNSSEEKNGFPALLLCLTELPYTNAQSLNSINQKISEQQEHQWVYWEVSSFIVKLKNIRDN